MPSTIQEEIIALPITPTTGVSVAPSIAPSTTPSIQKQNTLSHNNTLQATRVKAAYMSIEQQAKYLDKKQTPFAAFQQNHQQNQLLFQNYQIKNLHRSHANHQPFYQVNGTQMLPTNPQASMFTYFPQSNGSHHHHRHVLPDETLFDSKLFKQISIKALQNEYETLKLKKYSPTEYVFDLGDNLILRSLRLNDYERDYLKLLEQLTIVGDVSCEQFVKRFRSMKSCPHTYYTIVIEDRVKDKVVGSVTLVFEQKFIRQAAARGRVEDLVVDDGYRGKKLGKVLVDFATHLSKHLGCYKTSLECSDNIKDFYRAFGFNLEDGQNYLCKRFDERKKPENTS